jgi:hypothetical protein
MFELKFQRVVGALLAAAIVAPGTALAAKKCTAQSNVKKPLGEIRVFVQNDAANNFNIYGGSETLDTSVTIKPGQRYKVVGKALHVGSNDFTIYVLATELVDGWLAAGTKTLRDIVQQNAYKASFTIVGEATSNGKGQNHFASGASVNRYLDCKRDWSNGKNRWNITVTRK